MTQRKSQKMIKQERTFKFMNMNSEDQTGYKTQNIT